MINRQMTFDKIKQALLKEPGPAEVIRFLQQFETGTGDYSIERHSCLKDCTVESLLEDIKKMKSDKS
jgi:hypothetical protein